MSPKYPKVQLFVCEYAEHQIEAVLGIYHVAEKGQPKKFLNRMSTKGARAVAIKAMEDFDE